MREEDFPKKILTEIMDIYIIELPNGEKYGNLEKYKNLNLWVRFINNPEVFKMSENEKIEIAKKMLDKGLNIETIIELTELSKEEIEKLK